MKENQAHGIFVGISSTSPSPISFRPPSKPISYSFLSLLYQVDTDRWGGGGGGGSWSQIWQRCVTVILFHPFFYKPNILFAELKSMSFLQYITL